MSNDKLPEFEDIVDFDILSGDDPRYISARDCYELGRLLISHGYDTPEKVLEAIENDALDYCCQWIGLKYGEAAFREFSAALDSKRAELRGIK